MGVEVRGPGQEGVEEGDQVAGVNTPIILRYWSLFCAVQLDKCNFSTIFRIEDLEELLHRDFKQFSCQVCGCITHEALEHTTF